MDVATLKNHIKLKTIPAFLIFAGDEWKVQDIYIQQIAKVTGKEVVRIDELKSVYRTMQMKTAKPKIYVVRDDYDLLHDESLQTKIESVLGSNILILLLTSIDKRTKFYKAFKASIIEFERLPDRTLYKYALKEIKLSERNLERLIEVCEHDYGRILLEIDKIKRYCTVQSSDEKPTLLADTAFDWLLEDGTIYTPPYDAIFDLVSAILDRKVNKTFDLLQQSYEVGEATMVMLSVLYNNAKAVLQIQTYEGNNLSKATGLTGWQIKNAKPHVGKYKDKELIRMLKLIQQIESGIKTGKIEDEFAMNYLLTKIL